MLTKVLMGVSAAAVVALLVVFNMLLSSQEARGKLAGEVMEAVGANAAQTEKIDLLIQEAADLQERYEAEQARSDAFTKAVAVGQVELEKQKDDFAIELAGVRDSLTDEDWVCASEPIPDPYFSRLRDGPGGSNEDGVP